MTRRKPNEDDERQLKDVLKMVNSTLDAIQKILEIFGIS